MGDATDLAGRDTELAVLREVLAGGSGGALLLRGDPGIGKSALLDAAADVARAAGRRVLTTVGVEAEAQIPLAGLHQLLGRVLAHADTLPERFCTALHTSFGLAAGPRPEPFLLAEAVLALLVESAAARPLAVLADDLQWLDPQTNEVLGFVARRCGGTRVAVVGAVRTGHPGRWLPGTRVVELAGLDGPAAEHLLRRCAPELTPGDRQRVRREAQGNPLALLELPTVRGRGAGPGAGSTLTERLERAFAGRTAELAPCSRDAVLVAATDHADDVDEILRAAALLSRAADDADDPLGPAERAGLLTVVDGRLAFRHPLVRSAVLAAESPGRREAAHAALAQVLPDGSSRRTRHRARSLVGPDEAIAAELERTAGEALDRGAVDTAIADLERAAELTAGSARRGHRLLVAAEHAFELGRVDLLEHLLDAARRTDLTELDAARLQWLREILGAGTQGDATRVMELCDAARRSADAGDPDLALNLLLGAGLRCWWADTGPDARARVVGVARGLPVPRDARYVAVLAVAEPVLEGAAVAALLDRTVPAGSPVDVDLDAGALRLLGMAAHAVGDSPRAGRLLDRAETLLRDQGRLGLLAHVLSMQVVVRLARGDLSGALAAVDEGLRVAEDTGQPIWSTGTLVCAARAEAYAGRPERALDLADRAELAANRQNLNDLLACVETARGLAHLDTGRVALAHDAFAALFDPASPAFHQRERFEGVMFFAETAVATGNRRHGRDVLADLEAVAAVTPSPLLHAHLRHARAVLADPDRAEQLFRAALRPGVLDDWPWVRARTQQAFAAWLADAGRTAEAVGLLDAATATFHATGALTWVAQAQDRRARLAGGRGWDERGRDGP